MSEQNITVNTGNQLFVNTDTSKIFIGNNRYTSYPYNNSAYDDVTLLAGTIMGVVTATGWVIPLRSTASDGSQVPVGILAEDHIVDGGDLVDVSICVSGDVNANELVFDLSTDNLDTTISSRRLRDRIGADTVGIKLVNTTEMTKEDNS